MMFQPSENEPLSKHTTFAIGGPARWFFRVKEYQGIKNIVQWLGKEQVPYFTLGGGSNVLAYDHGFDGLVIKMEDRTCEVKGNLITASAGAILAVVAHKASEAGLSGLEWAFGVPGTIGGAVRGNAGAFGKSIADVLVMAEIIDVNSGDIIRCTPDELHFSYRTSLLKQKKHWIVTHALLKLTQSDVATSRERLRSFVEQKRERQPLGAACAGCVFKNVPVDSFPSRADIPIEFLEKGFIPASYLIEKANLKNHIIGKAIVSPKHGNFIINQGGARAQDVLDLIALAKGRTRETFGILLQEEIQYIQ